MHRQAISGRWCTVCFSETPASLKCPTHVHRRLESDMGYTIWSALYVISEWNLPLIPDSRFIIEWRHTHTVYEISVWQCYSLVSNLISRILSRILSRIDPILSCHNAKKRHTWKNSGVPLPLYMMAQALKKWVTYVSGSCSFQKFLCCFAYILEYGTGISYFCISEVIYVPFSFKFFKFQVSPLQHQPLRL